MKELLKEVELTVKCELKRANKVHPLFNSPHEAYAVIKEEVEEAELEMEHIKDSVRIFWKAVKYDDSAKNMCRFLHGIKDIAMNLAAEAIQVAAMAQKAIDSINAILKCDNNQR